MYQRNHKILCEKEKGALLLEEEVKTYKRQVKILNIDLLASKTKEKEFLMALEQQRELFNEKNIEIQRKIKDFNDLNESFDLLNKKSKEERSLLTALEAKQKDFEEEKRQLEIVKGLILKGKDSSLAFDHINNEKEIENWRCELEKMKKSKNLLEIESNKKFLSFKDENRMLKQRINDLEVEFKDWGF